MSKFNLKGRCYSCFGKLPPEEMQATLIACTLCHIMDTFDSNHVDQRLDRLVENLAEMMGE